VTINRPPRLRSCTAHVTNGMDIRTHTEPLPTAAHGDVMTESQADVAVVGGGPADCTRRWSWPGRAEGRTARRVRRPGRPVLQAPGRATHRCLRRLPPARHRADPQVRSAGVVCRTAPWSGAPRTRAAPSSPRRPHGRPRPGSHPGDVGRDRRVRTLPALPGWTLPGVVTPGFALHLATMDRVPVGSRVVLAGTGPFLLPVACALLEVGARIEALVELNHPYRPRPSVIGGALRQPARLARRPAICSPSPARRTGRTGRPRARRVRRHPGHRRGHRPRGRQRTAVGDRRAVRGLRLPPSTELPRLLGCRTEADATGTEQLPVVDADGATSVDGLRRGDGAGIAGVHAAGVRGQLAPTRSCAVWHPTAPPYGGRPSPPGPPWTVSRHWPTGSTPCRHGRHPRHHPGRRCEGVSAGEIRQAAASGWNDLHGTKAATRAGMGPCRDANAATSSLRWPGGARRSASRPGCRYGRCPWPRRSKGRRSRDPARRRRHRRRILGASAAFHLAERGYRSWCWSAAPHREGSGTTAGNLHIQASTPAAQARRSRSTAPACCRCNGGRPTTGRRSRNGSARTWSCGAAVASWSPKPPPRKRS